MREDDVSLERVVARLRETPAGEAQARDRVRAALAREAGRRRRGGAAAAGALGRLRAAPAGWAGFAAVAAAVALLLARGAGAGPGDRPVRFTLVDARASSVALVGDFNDWDPAVTPLRRLDGAGLWAVELPLAPGQHGYSFVIDGRRWAPDPNAPRAAGEDFGRPSSVVLVGDAT